MSYIYRSMVMLIIYMALLYILHLYTTSLNVIYFDNDKYIFKIPEEHLLVCINILIRSITASYKRVGQMLFHLILSPDPFLILWWFTVCLWPCQPPTKIVLKVFHCTQNKDHIPSLKALSYLLLPCSLQPYLISLLGKLSALKLSYISFNYSIIFLHPKTIIHTVLCTRNTFSWLLPHFCLN